MRALSLLNDILRHRQGEVNLPRFLTYIVTFKCNARCIMCDCWKMPSPDELTIEEIERVYRQLPRMDGVRLSGGEPFIRPDFGDIARLTVELLQPRFLHVTTNGFLTKRIVEFCEKRPRSLPLQLLVSLDGTEEKHNHVRGRDSAWKTAFATVQELAPRQKELRLRVGVNQTIVDGESISEYRKLRELLKPMNVRVSAVVAYDVSATYSLEHEKEAAPKSAGQYSSFGKFGPEDTRELVSALESELEGFNWFERTAKNYYLEGIRNRLLHSKGDPNPSCVALNAHMRLFPNGDVPVCQFNSKRVGNLRRETFAALWQGESIRGHREWVRGCPGCWAECEVLPNALYSGDAFRYAARQIFRRKKTRATDSLPVDGLADARA